MAVGAHLGPAPPSAWPCWTLSGGRMQWELGGGGAAPTSGGGKLFHCSEREPLLSCRLQAEAHGVAAVGKARGGAGRQTGAGKGEPACDAGQGMSSWVRNAI